MNTTLKSVLPVPAALLLAICSVGGCEKKPETVPVTRDGTSSTTSTTTRTNGATSTTTTPNTTPAADNTARNKVDAKGGTMTPMDQSEASADIKTTADIRRAILDDKAMSTNAQNCKIITDKTGMVTLRGAVNSQAEKDSIASKARAIAGDSKVDNQLEVKTN